MGEAPIQRHRIYRGHPSGRVAADDIAEALELTERLRRGERRAAILSKYEWGAAIPWVYFIEATDGSVKIGKSTNVQKRLKCLQTSHSGRLRLLGVVAADCWSETLLHRRFKHLRLYGEWFRGAPEIHDFIKEQSSR